jgi:hypothetical protein
MIIRDVAGADIRSFRTYLGDFILAILANDGIKRTVSESRYKT